MYAYWTALRGGAPAPRRFDIEPSRIAPLLPDTFILEKVGPRDYRYRIAGTAICDLFRLELRDEGFLSGWNPADRLVMERTLAVVTMRGAVGRYEIEALPPARSQPDGRLAPMQRLKKPPAATERLRLRGVLLPLIHTEGRMDRVLGALAPVDQALPTWVTDEGRREPPSSWRLTSLETDWPRGEALAAMPELERFGRESAVASGPAIGERESEDRQTPFVDHVRRARIVRSDRRQFRVYDGGRAGDGDKS